MGSCSSEREEGNQPMPQSQEEQNLNAMLLLSSSELSCPLPHTPPHTGPKPSTVLTRALKLKHKLQHQSTPPDTAPLEPERQKQRHGQIQMRRGRASERGVAISPGNLDSWSLGLGSLKHIISDKRAESDEHPAVPACFSWHWCCHGNQPFSLSDSGVLFF